MKKMLVLCWCPNGLNKTQRHQLQKLQQVEIASAWEEAEHDACFNQAHPIIEPKRTWREKRLAREEGDVDSRSSSASDGKDADVADMTAQSVEVFEVNMVFTILEEFLMPETEVAELALGVERVVLKKPSKPSEHMKPLYIKGHMDGLPVGRMMVDGGASVNIMSLTLFEKLGRTEVDLK
jgi:hypothetical protein